jgi:hypothetical protein
MKITKQADWPFIGGHASRYVVEITHSPFIYNNQAQTVLSTTKFGKCGQIPPTRTECQRAALG